MAISRHFHKYFCSTMMVSFIGSRTNVIKILFNDIVDTPFESCVLNLLTIYLSIFLFI